MRKIKYNFCLPWRSDRTGFLAGTQVGGVSAAGKVGGAQAAGQIGGVYATGGRFLWPRRSSLGGPVGKGKQAGAEAAAASARRFLDHMGGLTYHWKL